MSRSTRICERRARLTNIVATEDRSAACSAAVRTASRWTALNASVTSPNSSRLRTGSGSAICSAICAGVSWVGQRRVAQSGDRLRQAVLGDGERALLQLAQRAVHRAGHRPGDQHRDQHHAEQQADVDDDLAGDVVAQRRRVLHGLRVDRLLDLSASGRSARLIAVFHVDGSRPAGIVVGLQAVDLAFVDAWTAAGRNRRPSGRAAPAGRRGDQVERVERLRLTGLRGDEALPLLRRHAALQHRLRARRRAPATGIPSRWRWPTRRASRSSAWSRRRAGRSRHGFRAGR